VTTQHSGTHIQGLPGVAAPCVKVSGIYNSLDNWLASLPTPYLPYGFLKDLKEHLLN